MHCSNFQRSPSTIDDPFIINITVPLFLYIVSVMLTIFSLAIHCSLAMILATAYICHMTVNCSYNAWQSLEILEERCTRQGKVVMFGQCEVWYFHLHLLRKILELAKNYWKCYSNARDIKLCLAVLHGTRVVTCRGMVLVGPHLERPVALLSLALKW